MTARWRWSSVLLLCLSTGLASAGPPPVVLEDIHAATRDWRFADARRLARELIARVEDEQGPESLAVADAIDALLDAAVRSQNRRLPELIDLGDRALAIRKSRLADDHPSVAVTLFHRGGMHQLLAGFDEATDDLRSALDILERAGKADSDEYARCLIRSGAVRADAGKRSEAIEQIEQGLDLTRAIHGEESEPHLEALMALAWEIPSADDRKQRLAEQALELATRMFDQDHPRLAQALTLRGATLWLNSEYDEAEQAGERALRIFEKVLGPDDFHVSWCIGYLAIIRAEQGDLAGSRRMFERALRITSAQLPPDHVLATPLQANLSIVYRRMGQLAPARELLNRILEKRIETLGEIHPKVASTLSSRGDLEARLGEFEAALRSSTRALEIFEQIPETPGQRALQLRRIGIVELATGRLDRAQELLERAFEQDLDNWGEPSLTVGLTSEALGATHTARGNFDTAATYFARALANFNAVARRGSAYVARVQAETARNHLLAGRPGPALQLALTAERRAREMFRENTRVFAESEALSLHAERIRGLDVGLASLEALGPLASSETIRDVLEELVRSRAIVIDEMAARHPGFLEPTTEEHRRLLKNLRDARSEISRLAVRAGRPDPPDGLSAELDQARVHLTLTERRVAEWSSAFRRRLARFDASLPRIAGSVPADAALVSFVRFTTEGTTRSHVTPTGKSSKPRESAYGAFVLKGGGREIAWIAMGSADSIDGKVRDWLSEIRRRPPLLPAGAIEAESRARRAGEALRRQVWDPLESAIGSSRLILVVPDGALHHVNVAALPSSGDSYVVESDRLIHYLSAERDLVRSDDESAQGTGVIAFGGPDFEGSARTTFVRDNSTALRGTRSRCSTNAGSFIALPAAQLEVRKLEELWRSSSHEAPEELAILTGVDATESAFKDRAPGRRIVHIATHAFQPAPGCSSVLENHPASGTLENPLIQSGLVFAGANREPPAQSALGDRFDDGMLTAQEIASLDFSSAEWVVLSGCDTGTGEVRTGEGVLGLRRAFEVSGVRTLIMSLWEVEDEATRRWMTHLYAARFRGMTTAEAVRESTIQTLATRRGSGSSTHPFFWGAFTATGDWR